MRRLSLTMSVDKFGRYSDFGEKFKYNEKRGGLPLTPDGDYNISNKRLKFVNDPQDDNDAVNLKTLKSETTTSLKLEEDEFNANLHRITNVAKPINNSDSVTKEYLMKELTSTLQSPHGKSYYSAKSKRIVNMADPIDDLDSVNRRYLHTLIPQRKTDAFSFYNFVINDIGYPQEDTDAVNLKYIKDHCIIHNVGVIDCQDNVIGNVKEGTALTDAATISQIMQAKNGEWYAQDKRISNVNKGVETNDVTIVNQVPVTTDKYKHNDKKTTSFDCKHLTLANLHKAVLPHEAVRLDQMQQSCLVTNSNNEEIYTCNNRRITDLHDPESLNDAVTVNYLARLLGTMMFDIHNDLVDKNKIHNTIHENNRDRWIHEHIIRKYFIAPGTKAFRTQDDRSGIFKNV